jgi:CDP-diglyceride synthetase
MTAIVALILFWKIAKSKHPIGFAFGLTAGCFVVLAGIFTSVAATSVGIPNPYASILPLSFLLTLQYTGIIWPVALIRVVWLKCSAKKQPALPITVS